PVLPLMPQEVVHATDHADGVGDSRREQSDEGPGGLGGRTVSHAGHRWISIGYTGLSPSTVRILFGFQPRHRLPHIGHGHVLTDCPQPSQDRPSAVNIIDAPAAIPTAIRLL